MIVEDNPEMRRVIRRLISGLAAEIVECTDGDEALAVYARTHPDWVLMDIEMAGLDGITATRLITEAFPDGRIIIVTNHNDEPLRVAAREAGACGFVLKENLLDLQRLLSAQPEHKSPSLEVLRGQSEL